MAQIPSWCKSEGLHSKQCSSHLLVYRLCKSTEEIKPAGNIKKPNLAYSLVWNTSKVFTMNITYSEVLTLKLEALLNSNVLYYLTQACFHPFFKNAKLIANILSYQKTTSGSFNIYWIVSETLTNFVMIPLPKFIINNNKKLFLYLSAAYNFNQETKVYRSRNQFKQVPTQTQDAACLMRHHLGFCIYEQVVFHWHQ